MSKLAELTQKRTDAAKAIKELRDSLYTGEGDDRKPREMTAEERQKWDTVNKDYDRYDEQIKLEERMAKIDKDERERQEAEERAKNDKGARESFQGQDGRSESNRGEVTDEDRDLAFAAWARTQAGLDIDERMQEACDRTGIKPNRRMFEFDLAPTSYAQRLCRTSQRVHESRREEELRKIPMESRALSSITGSSGGATVSQTFVRNLEVAMLRFGGVRNVADIIRTDNGEDLIWPTADDTGNIGVQLGESASAATEADPTFGQVTWKAYKFSSKMVKVPTELMEDSAFNIAGMLPEWLGERLGRITAQKDTTGPGAAGPRGIVTSSTLGVTAASATSIAADEFLNLIHSVPTAYRGDPSVGFMLNDAIVLHVRKLKDGEGRYLWGSGLEGGVANQIAGYPVTISEEMASTMASGNKTVLFGAFRYFKIREVRGVRMYRLVERYRENDQEGFVAFLRHDANLLDAGKGPVRHLVHP